MTIITVPNWEDLKETVEKASFQHEKYGKVIIFTNANQWYIKTLIKNLYKSFEIHEPDRNLLIFSTDQEGYEECKELGFKYFGRVEIPQLGVSKITNLHGDDRYSKYVRLCFVKIVLIKYMLENGYTPLYIDPDMALTKPCVEDLLSYLGKGNSEFVVAGKPDYINTNVMITRPIFPRVMKMFQVEIEHVEEIIKYKLVGDEAYISTRLIQIYKIPYVCLNRKDHVNGQDCRKAGNSLTVHANCVSGVDNKKELLKAGNGWYIE